MSAWTYLEYPKVLLCEIPEIDPLVRFEVERELATIPVPITSAHVVAEEKRKSCSPLILRIDDLHWHASLSCLLPADHQRIVLVPQLVHHTTMNIDQRAFAVQEVRKDSRLVLWALGRLCEYPLWHNFLDQRSPVIPIPDHSTSVDADAPAAKVGVHRAVAHPGEQSRKIGSG